MRVSVRLPGGDMSGRYRWHERGAVQRLGRARHL